MVDGSWNLAQLLGSTLRLNRAEFKPACVQFTVSMGNGVGLSLCGGGCVVNGGFAQILLINVSYQLSIDFL
jgi:hypothetical protein